MCFGERASIVDYNTDDPEFRYLGKNAFKGFCEQRAMLIYGNNDSQARSDNFDGSPSLEFCHRRSARGFHVENGITEGLFINLHFNVEESGPRIVCVSAL